MIADAHQLIALRLNDSAAVKRKLAEEHVETILELAEELTAAVKRGGKIMLCGNGGSAADAQHVAAEFTSRLCATMERPPIAALALTTDTSFLTARSNDYGFEDVFERLVIALGKPADVLVGLSTSGNSPNVIAAVKRCGVMGIRTIGLLGGDGGVLRRQVDIPVVVPSNSVQHTQEAHITIAHIVCELVEQRLYGDLSRSSTAFKEAYT